VWRDTAEAAAIPGVSKPTLLHRIEWHADGPEPALVTDLVASREQFLRTAPGPATGIVPHLAAPHSRR
jgi:hypothetical protein